MYVQCRTQRIQTDMLGNESPTPNACMTTIFGTLCCFIAVMALATEFAMKRDGATGLANGLSVVLLGFRVTITAPGAGCPSTRKALQTSPSLYGVPAPVSSLGQRRAPQIRPTLEQIKSLPHRESRRMPDERRNSVTFADSAKACLEARQSLRTSSQRSIHEMYARSAITAKH